MDKKEFNNLLKKAGLNKKEFSKLAHISYNTVAGWGSINKPVPNWVKSWIDNYQKAQIIDDIKNKVCSNSNG